MDEQPNKESADLSTTRPAMAVGLLARVDKLIRSRYLWSVGAQGLVSAFHFALNLILVRSIAPADFGIYAFAFVLAMFSSAVNNALIATPLTVWTPVIKDPQERQRSESMFSTLNSLLFFVLGAVGCVYAMATEDSVESRLTVLGVVTFVAVYAARQYSRTTGYARLRPLVPAAGDLSYVVVGSVLVTALFMRPEHPPVGMVLFALALANAAAMLVESVCLNRRLQFPQGLSGWQFLGGYRAMWPETRWALIGSLTTLVLGHAHSLVVTWRLGPEAFAPLAAGYVLFGPVRIALVTWQNMVKPELAVALSEGRVDAVRQQLKLTTLKTAIAVCVLGVVLTICWPWIYDLLYASQYSDAPMGLIVGLWAITTFLAASYNAPSAALQALKEFRALAHASIYGAVLSLSLVLVLLWSFGATPTLLGVLAAEAFLAVWLMRVLNAKLDVHAGSHQDLDTVTSTDAQRAPA